MHAKMHVHERRLLAMRWLGVRRIVWGVLGLACGLLPLGQGGQAAQIDTGVYIDIRASEAPGAG